MIHRDELSSNLVGVPTSVLASVDFNAEPRPLHVSGVREDHHTLFRYLSEAASAFAAGTTFQDYMTVVFALTLVGRRDDGQTLRHYTASYLKLLADWGFDANGVAGAVLKAWVESRFGLYPTFHKGPLPSGLSGPHWSTYVTEKMASRYHNNSIYQQIDLLYEFCQWHLARFNDDSTAHIKLYRGVNRVDEERVGKRTRGHEMVVTLNNLSSFTHCREIADEFGDYILEVDVPKVKILFFNELLPRHPLKGEAEYLVIGGEYRVTRHTL